MKEQVKGILFDFKKEGWSIQKLEKELGFSNGSLGKAASGKVNLSEVRFIKLLELHQKTFKKTPTVTEALKKEIKENNASPKKQVINDERNSITDEKENTITINFGDDWFLDVEKYTQFPKKEKPTEKWEAEEWVKIKAFHDKNIRDAWAIHKLKNK